MLVVFSEIVRPGWKMNGDNWTVPVNAPRAFTVNVVLTVVPWGTLRITAVGSRAKSGGTTSTVKMASCLSEPLVAFTVKMQRPRLVSVSADTCKGDWADSPRPRLTLNG